MATLTIRNLDDAVRRLVRNTVKCVRSSARW